MINLQLGPLALPLNPLLMMAGWWLASAVADRLARHEAEPTPRRVARAMLLAAALGLLVSRAGFVAMGWAGYVAEPLSTLNLRDGGWMPLAGLLTALGVLGGMAVHHAATRRPLIVGALAGLLLWGGATTALGVHQRPALPALSLASLEGPSVALHAQPGRPMVINLWASWCGPCQVEMPYLAQAQRARGDIRFVFVNHGERAETVQRWLAQQPYVLSNVLLDPQMALGAAVGTTGLPTTLFIDAQGRLVERHFGPLSAASLQARLQNLR